MQAYTVVGIYRDNDQSGVWHEMASDPDIAALLVKAKGVRVVAVFEGHHQDVADEERDH